MSKKGPSRYAAIAPVVDTGAVATKISHTHKSDNQIAKRRGELFKRARCARVASLLSTIEADQAPESVYDITEDSDCSKTMVTMRSHGGRSAVSLVQSESAGLRDARDFLIVDLRPEEEYRESRILYAVNHPGTFLARDVVHASMSLFKNKVKDRYLVVYHRDDKQSAFYASILCEKGWDEIFIIEGGFEEFRSGYPELIESDKLW